MANQDITPVSAKGEVIVRVEQLHKYFGKLHVLKGVDEERRLYAVSA